MGLVTAIKNRSARRRREAPPTPDVALVIDADEYEESRHDPRVIEFVRQAEAEGLAAEREGRVQY